jgi:uncharacterized protein (TIGR03437 family)
MSNERMAVSNWNFTRMNLLRLALSLFLLASVCGLNAVAQPVDRAQLLNEIIALQNQIKNTTDPGQLAALQEQLRTKEAIFLSPAQEDFAAHADFLKQPDTGLIRIMPREGFDGTLSTRGGGAYYSFIRLTHEYGYGSDLELQRGEFSVGFAGADFGFLVSLGVAELGSVTLEHPGVKYLATFASPTSEPEAREQQRRSSAGFQENGIFYRRRVAATVGATYAVRSVGYRGSDALIAFRATRQDNDGSLILVWKLLKWFPTPQLNSGSIASVSAASYRRGVFGRESIVALFGNDLSATTAVADKLPLPTSLGGVSVSMSDGSGHSGYAQLFAVTPNQVNLLVNANLVDGPAFVTVYRPNGGSFTEIVRIAPVSPGLFTANADGQGVPAAVALRVRNGAQTYEPVAQFDNAQNKFIPAPIDLGAETDQVFLLLFGTGVRHRTSLDRVDVRIGGIDAPAPFAGAQGLTGLDQINVTIPRSLIGRGEVDLVLTVDGQIANVVRLNFK